jgi:hypothetical protein
MLRSLPVSAPSRRPARLLSLVVAFLLMGSLVGACGSKSTPAVVSNGSGTATTVSAGTTAAPGTCPTSNTTSFAKTKFVAHAGLAFGAFHRYLYKPFKAGTFSSGHHGRIFALIKAAAAALFIKHEVELAAGDVRANPTLCKAIAAPLRGFYSAISGLGSSIRGGGTTGIDQAQSSLSSVISTAGGHGVSIVPNNNASI